MTTRPKTIYDAARVAAAIKEHGGPTVHGPVHDLATRLVETLDRVKELEIQVNDRLADAESFARRADSYWNQLEALKSAQTPRPMSEAPEPGTFVHAVVEANVPLHEGSDHEDWCLGRIVGYLPLPDQDKDSP